MTREEQNDPKVEARRDEKARNIGNASLVYNLVCKELGIATDSSSLFSDRSYMDRSGQGSNYSSENH